MSLSVSVSVLGGLPIEVKFSPSATVETVISEVIERENRAGAGILAKHVPRCFLWHVREGVFLDKQASLKDSRVSTGEFLKVVSGRDAGQVRLALWASSWSTGPTMGAAKASGRVVRMDFTEPLFRLIPRMMSLLKMKELKEEYVIRLAGSPEEMRADDEVSPSLTTTTSQGRKKAGKAPAGSAGSSSAPSEPLVLRRCLNMNLSLNEQTVPSQSTLLLLPLSCVASRPLSDYQRPAMQGWMTKTSRKADKKATGKKKRWCVLEDNVLSYFADNKPSAKPKGVVSVESMTCTTLGADGQGRGKGKKGDKQTAILLEKATVSWTKRALAFVFEPVDAADFNAWEAALTRVSSNGAPFRTFGVSLQALEERERDQDIPFIAEACMTHLRSDNNLATEGLFRLSGNQKLIEVWKNMFDRGLAEQAVAQFTASNSESVASLLKLYLREFEEPLCTFDKHDGFVDAVAEADVAQALSKLVRDLPLANQRLMNELLSFIAEVAEADNKMDMDSLCAIFAPNILRPRVETEVSLMTGGERTGRAVELLIQHRASLKFRRGRRIRKTSNQTLLAPGPSAAAAPESDGSSSLKKLARRGTILSSAHLGPPPALIAPPSLGAGSSTADAGAGAAPASSSSSSSSSSSKGGKSEASDDTAGAPPAPPPPPMGVNLPPPLAMPDLDVGDDAEAAAAAAAAAEAALPPPPPPADAAAVAAAAPLPDMPLPPPPES